MTFTSRQIAYLSLLTAACVVGRLSFQLIPNVQPMTAILLMTVFFLGLRDSLLVCLLSLLITNLFLGMGWWTLGQLLSFFLIQLVFFWLLKLPLIRRSFLLQGIFAGLLSFLYGGIISLYSVWLLRLPSFWAYWFQGLSFDLLHAIGTVSFYSLLFPILKHLFAKYYPK